MVLPDSTPDQLPTLVAGFVPPKDTDASAVASQFLGELVKAIAAGDGAAFAALFTQHGYWRDVLAFTREFHTFKTVDLAQVAGDVFPGSAAKDFTLVPTLQPKLETPFPDVAFVRAHFTFTGDVGPGYGTVSLVHDSGAWKAWTLTTELEGVNGIKQQVGDDRRYGRHNDTMPYDSRRAMETEMEGVQPDILIIGAGHNGLAVAALATSWGLDPLVIDKEERLGDNWRKRYASLSLHDPVMTNHLPMLPFPRNWPLFTSAGKLANWLESYADIMEINTWLRSTTDPSRTKFNTDTNMWEVLVIRTKPDGSTEERLIKTSHVVMATGLAGGGPRVPPPFPGQNEWAGKIVHSSKHPGGAGLQGKNVLVVGACTSAFDIAGDLANNNVPTTILQRSPTFIMSLKHGIHVLMGGVFNNTIPVDVADHIAAGTPRHVLKLFHQRLTAWLKQQDAELLAGLGKQGFVTYSGPDDAGFAFLAMERAGGYYFDTGTCQSITDGKIKIQQGEIASFDADSRITFKDGKSEKYDYVIFATGYTGYKHTVGGALGSGPAEQLTTVFGMDPEGEINGIARDCGIPNVLFNVGNLASARIFGKAIVLQILAQKNGAWKAPYYRPGSNVQASTTGGFHSAPKAANGNGTVNGH